MGYKKQSNNHKIWLDYCAKNISSIELTGLEEKVFLSENNFREFATNGTINNVRLSVIASELEDKNFWALFDFITNYFDMDASLFDDVENSRMSRGITLAK